MIILHIITDLAAGGAELMLKRLVEAGRDNPEFEHRIISLQGEARIGAALRAKGVPVEALGMRGPRDAARIIAQLAWRIRRQQPDVVHNWMYHANFLGGLAARIAGCGGVIWGIRATDFNADLGVSKLTTWLRRSSAAFSTWVPDVIAYVAHAAQSAHEDIGYSREKGIVIPNGYASVPLLSSRDARRRLGLPPDGPIIGSLGRFNAAKDPRNFVGAAALVARRHPGARFMMVGRGMGSANRELMSWIEDQGLYGRVSLFEERDDVNECLAAMDVFCLHSATEAFPNVVAEAMNAGVPCVVTDVGDAAMLVGDAGLVVPARDPDALARAVSRMIEADSGARSLYGRRGRERIAASFSIEAIVKRYEELYRDIAENARYPHSSQRRMQG